MFRIPDALKRSLQEGDSILICEHIFDAWVKEAQRGRPLRMNVREPVSYKKAGTFSREDPDHTEGAAAMAVWCSQCTGGPDTRYIEEIWKHGQFHVADVLRANPA